MNYELDIHTHTIASGHAYNTLQEMIYTAKEKGLRLLGVSDHAVAMPGTCHLYYFHNLKVVERQYGDLELMLGAEVNIIGYNGELDLDEETLAGLDYGIASLHMPCLAPGTKEQNINAMIKAMESPYIQVIGHPDDSRFSLDYEALVQAAKKNHVLIEINNSSLNPNGFRQNTRENDITILNLCKQYAVPVCLNSDAHVASDIGNTCFIDAVLNETNFPEDLIINTSVDKFKQFLSEK
ncbi:phosphatase [Anaerosporobacter faecicola]|uniref:phosphatase n=1 Tax=Anaerosporobacter faecicola TaxID=2718714 RepID=UPI00143BBE91|nr:phosphatase [Anaerosporobacter faecicola]